MANVLLLPGALPHDQATLRALTEGLPPHPALAAKLRGASVAKLEGSWSDAERAAGSCTGDLPGGLLLHAATVNTFTNTAATLAVASPLSAALGLTDLTPLDPGTLQLTDAEARALCDTCSEHLRAEDIDLTFVDAHRWLISCNHPVNVLTERPDWLIGENLRPNLPRGTDARLVERWMNELQMLLYTHPVNIAREDRGLPPVNVIWLWGFSSTSATGTEATEPYVAITTIADFATALRNGDLTGWQQAWSAHAEAVLDADQIIFGDNHPLLRVTPNKPGIMHSLFARFARPPALAGTLASLREQVAEVRS